MQIKKITTNNGIVIEGIEGTPSEIKELLGIMNEPSKIEVPHNINPIVFRRKRLGLTQKQLAEKAGLTVRGIQNYEITDRHPKGEYLIRLANALRVSPKTLSDELNKFDIPV